MTGALINIFTFRGGGGIIQQWRLFGRGAYLAVALIHIFTFRGGGGLIQQGRLFGRGAY